MAKKKISKKGEKKVNIVYIELNNKGRKGKYARVSVKGGNTRYYKRMKGLTKEDYRYAYIHKLNIRRGGIKKSRIGQEKRIDKISRKYPKIDKVLGKGYTQYTIKSLRELTPQGIRLSYKKLLMNKDKVGDRQGIVRDAELLSLITRSENVDKWKHRIFYEVILKNGSGDVLKRISNVKVKSLNDIKQEVLHKVKLGMDIGQFSKIMDEEGLRRKGYRVLEGGFAQGKVENINIKMVFRKGK